MIYFLIPVFNEEDHIPALARELTAFPDMAQKFYVFSDDGSTDGTVRLIAEYFPSGTFMILGDGKNYGPGHAFNTGFEWILQHSSSPDDAVVTMEADGTSDIGILRDMIQVGRLGYGLVLASVYAQGGGFDRTSLLRKLVSFAANMLFRLFFDLKVLTLSSFFRVYSMPVLREIKNRYGGTIIGEPGFISMLEILVKAIRCKAKIIEIPMKLHSSKRKGKSKMKVMRTGFSYVRFLINPVK